MAVYFEPALNANVGLVVPSSTRQLAIGELSTVVSYNFILSGPPRQIGRLPRKD